MKLSDLHPERANPIPMGDGIICGMSFDCPKDKKRRHSLYFYPPINPYPQFDLNALMTKLFAELGVSPHTRTAGESWDTLTILPSIGNMRRLEYRKYAECCHMNITNGEVTFT